MNRIILMGRLTRDPELRQTQSGTPVCSFTLAVDRRVGKDQELKADFIDCVSWNKAADFVKRYFVKGQMMAVEGRLQLRDWTDSDGHKRRNAEVVTDQVYFTGNKSERSAAEQDDGPVFDDIRDEDDDPPF